MKIYHKIASAFIAGLVLAASAVRAETASAVSSTGTGDFSFYAQPSVVAAFPGDFDNAVGAAVAVGTTYKGRHSLEADLIWFQSGKGSVDLTFTPIVATYKYTAALSDGWSVDVGGAVGATREHASYYGGSYNQTAFTYGAVAGASYALTPRVSLNADAWVLRLNNTNLTTSGSIVVVTLGVNFRL